MAAHGRTNLVYELRIANFDKKRQRVLQITRLDILGDADASPLATYEGDALATLLERPAVAPPPDDPRRLPCGEQAVAFIWLVLDPGSLRPRQLLHRLAITSEGWNRELEVEGGRVAVSADPAVVLAGPLKGSGWVTANGPSNGVERDEHRRSINTVDGMARIPQRFAVDWARFGPNGRLFHDDPGHNSSWWSYGAEVLAVSDGRIAELQDDIPDNSPGSYAVEITLENGGGNYISLDLGGGRYAAYCHLQPRSLLVRAGDSVREGQVLARVGNSGSSDAPHLHFQVTDGPYPFGSEGLPFVFPRFELLGTIHLSDDPAVAIFKPALQTASVRMEMPLEDDVLSFAK